MTAVTLRGLMARKARALLTGLAVLLGVAMISGTYIFTDTINSSFDKIFKNANEGVDVVVSGRSEFDTQSGPVTQEVPDSLVRRVRAVPGVLTAAGSVEDFASIFKANGDQVKTQGAPPLLFSRPPARFDPLEYVEGGPPANATQVAINQGTADDEDLKIGDRISLVGRTGRRSYTISGLAKFGDVSSLGGATVAVVTLPQAQLLAGQPHRVDSIQVAAEPGVTPTALADRLNRVLPNTVEAKTGRAGRHGRLRLGQEQPRIPEHAAARVRWDRDLRGRLHHLQHFLDHGRAAHERVRAAAHDGGLARPGTALRDARGADRGARRLVARPVGRGGRRQGPQRAVQELRGRSPAGGLDVQSSHGDRRLARRDARDHGREPCPGAPRDPRAAAGRDARGGRAGTASRPAPQGPLMGAAVDRRGGNPVRALRRRARRAGARRAGSRRGGAVHRRRPAEPARRPADRGAGRLSARTAPRSRRTARARELDPQPEPHGRDRCIADDRPRAGDLRVDPGGRAPSRRSTTP